MRVLAIRDGRQPITLMRSHLVKRGFIVDTVETVAAGVALAGDSGHEIILLDLSLPSDGLHILQTLLRFRYPVGILVLSARDAVRERIALLDAGADDCLVKPFDLDELASRMRAVARRLPSPPQPGEGSSGSQGA
jgi:DNA-binding response OmpR family regulator